jgi:hypothetical protein
MGAFLSPLRDEYCAFIFFSEVIFFCRKFGNAGFPLTHQCSPPVAELNKCVKIARITELGPDFYLQGPVIIAAILMLD